MNKVISVNLGGTAFQLEDAGYDALRAYLDSARQRLAGNPDCDEILSDIERAIAEKFRAQLNAHKNVILTAEVQAVIAQMGPIEADTESNASAQSNPAGAGASDAHDQAQAGAMPRPQPKRLYRLTEGAQLSGVCNGLGAYFNIDPTFLRLAFVILVLCWGTGILVYLILAIGIPEAKTAEQKAAVSGLPATAQEFIRRARAGYYEAMRSFPDRHARREWKRRFKSEMRGWRASFHRETARHAEDWRHRYQSGFAAHPGASIALPIISLLHGAFLVCWLGAIVSLLATGAIFGVALPTGLPTWGAILILLFLHGLLVWPLKAVRRGFYYVGPTGPEWTVFVLVDVFVWIAIVALFLWLAWGHFDVIRDALHNLPVVAHDGANAIRDWWHRK